ncbi:TetR/AcrR family transcriptional regulator [Synoicihabitans lomoniglobus]|uniref:TetR/AcrR family transcriptional regulator n=1 Tax=Synoicihabitans lomoniglobus TaxID=2909285 RepID=A0AAF0CMW9_9BACT|nr:TetR/AcrR family transcriptional regulator [Opitutaceae bacterium LMO-M01]WED63650.1 TetR/AcrR family transcriptional regulator [Opitutaceae bacterium LMO-M01]
MGRPSDAKERLMTSAIDLIWEGSYGAVTIDDICRGADVRKGSFYYFFPGKAELAVAAIERMWEIKWKPFLDKNFSADLEPLERFTGYFQALVQNQKELFAEHGKVLGCPVASVGTEVSVCQAAVSDAIRDVITRKKRFYESAIRDAVAAGAIEPCDPAVKATALFCLIDGMMGQSRMMNDVSVFDNLTSMACDLLRFKTPVTA